MDEVEVYFRNRRNKIFSRIRHDGRMWQGRERNDVCRVFGQSNSGGMKTLRKKLRPSLDLLRIHLWYISIIIQIMIDFKNILPSQFSAQVIPLAEHLLDVSRFRYIFLLCSRITLCSPLIPYMIVDSVFFIRPYGFYLGMY